MKTYIVSSIITTISLLGVIITVLLTSSGALTSIIPTLVLGLITVVSFTCREIVRYRYERKNI